MNRNYVIKLNILFINTVERRKLASPELAQAHN